MLSLGIVLFWAFRKLWEGAVVSFDPRVPVYRTAAAAGPAPVVAAPQPAPPVQVAPPAELAPPEPAAAVNGVASPLVGAAAPAGAAPDNLRRMIGIGPVNERHLNGLGVTTFAQIASWTPEDVARVEAVLAFDGRIARERWVEQAGLLANGETEEFLRRFPQAGRGGNT